MNNDPISVEVRPIKQEEKLSADLCIDLSFSKSKEEISHQGFFRQFNYLPIRKTEFQWAVFVNKEPVAGVIMVPYHIQIGNTCFHMVGLTGVGTHPDHRHKGYSTRLLQGVHQYLTQEGYAGAVLHSAADDLYIKNGYEPCFGALSGIIQQNQFNSLIPSTHSSLATEFLMGTDINPDIYRILWSIRNQDPLFCQRTVKIQRGLEYFTTKLKEQLENGLFLAVIKQNNQIIGYGTARLGKILSIVEQYCLFAPSELRILFLLQLWGNFLNEFEPLPQALEVNYFMEDITTRNLIEKFHGKSEWRYMTGNMALFFDPFLILNQLQSDFCMRIEDSLFRELIGTIRLHIGEKVKQHIDMHISHGEITFILLNNENILVNPNYPLLLEGSLTSREFTLIIFGFEEIIEILDERNITGNPDVMKILPILFPKQYPIWDYGDPY